MLSNGRTATREQLLRAIESGEHLPDQFLPIGIHRISATRYRALLCTGGHKFKGPGRDTIREALEDRRKLCEQTGVDFVIYGKQTHVKGERPVGWQNAAVNEDGSTTVPVIPGRTVPKDLAAAIRVAPVKTQPVSATISGRFAAPAGEAAPAGPSLGGPEGPEDVVYTRRKTQYAEYKLAKKERKTFSSSMSRNRVYNHPYNLFLDDVSFSVVGGGGGDGGLAPVAVEVVIENKTISDKFLWSVHSQDQTGLDVYLTGLLLDAGLAVTYERMQLLRQMVEEQLAGFRAAVLFKPPTPSMPQPTTVQLFLDKVKLSAYTEEQVAKEFAQVYAAEHGMTDAGSVLWQVIDQCVAARAQDLAQTLVVQAETPAEEAKRTPRPARATNKSR